MPWSADGQWWTDPNTLERHSRGEIRALNNANPDSAPEWVALARKELPSVGQSGDPTSVEGGMDQLGQSFGAIGNAFGFVPKQADGSTPGATLDTSQADAERQQTTALLGQLQQQAATGGGAWEGSLKDATDRASAAASSVGQSQRGVGYASALRHIGDAQGGVAQRSVGQGKILREQSKQSAQQQIDALGAQQGEQDINQSNAEGTVNQGVGQLNTALASQGNKNLLDTTKAGAQALMTLSKGGEVPGKAPVFGDDSRNDVVPAKLSPGEIVIPRSHAGSPEQAADFVRALQKRQPLHFDAGGQVPMKPIEKAHPKEFRDSGGLKLGTVGQDFGVASQAPTIENGGLLNNAPYQENRSAVVGNQAALGASAAGLGPTIAPQMAQNAGDANIAAAMRSSAPAGTVASAASQGVLGGGADAAAKRAEEQQAGQLVFGKSLARQRAQDLSMAKANQEAAWRNTQLSAGLGLEQQALLRGMVSGAGQAATAFTASDKGTRAMDFGGSDLNAPEFDQGLSDAEWNPYPGGSSGGIAEPNDKAMGGYIEDTRGADFVSALKRRKR